MLFAYLQKSKALRGVHLIGLWILESKVEYLSLEHPTYISFSLNMNKAGPSATD